MCYITYSDLGMVISTLVLLTVALFLLLPTVIEPQATTTATSLQSEVVHSLDPQSVLIIFKAALTSNSNAPLTPSQFAVDIWGYVITTTILFLAILCITENH